MLIGADSLTHRCQVASKFSTWRGLAKNQLLSTKWRNQCNCFLTRNSSWLDSSVTRRRWSMATAGVCISNQSPPPLVGSVISGTTLCSSGRGPSEKKIRSKWAATKWWTSRIRSAAWSSSSPLEKQVRLTDHLHVKNQRKMSWIASWSHHTAATWWESWIIMSTRIHSLQGLLAAGKSQQRWSALRISVTL